MLIDDIEYVIFCHSDLAAVRQFMIDFGLLDVGQQGDSLYLRAYGDAPFSYVTSQGEAAFVGMGFRVANQEALAQLAARFGADIEDCPHPGGGKYSHTTDPEGFHVEHFSDGDMVNEDTPTQRYPFGRDTQLQWGPAFPGL